MRVWMYLLICVSTMFPALAKSACEECVWPLAGIIGDWQTDDESITLVAREVRRNKTQVEISITVRRADHRVLARGRAVVPLKESQLRVRLQFANGTSRNYVIRLDPYSKQLIVDGSGGDQFQRCQVQGHCLLMHKDAADDPFVSTPHSRPRTPIKRTPRAG